MLVNGRKDIGINVRSGAPLRSGESVFFKVLEAGSDSYKIKLKSEILTIKTGLFLKTGTIYRARLIFDGNKTLLRLDKPVFKNITGTTSEHIRLPVIINAAVLRQTGQIDQKLVSKIEEIMKKRGKNDIRTARFLALLADKGISLDSDLDELLYLNSGGGRKGEGEGREQQKREDSRRKGDIYIENEEFNRESGTSLTVLNHLKAENQNWMVFPIKLSKDGILLEGIIRFLLKKDGKIHAAAVELGNDAESWSFIIESLPDGKKKCSILEPELTKNLSNKKKLKNLIKKLQNLGVIFDDTNTEDIIFDGFSIIENPGFKPVDTWV